MCEEGIKKAKDPVFKYILPDICSDAEKEVNPITAEKIVDAIKYGKKVEIKNAVITGPFILKSVNVEGEITIKNTKIKGSIDWSYATFKRVLNLKNSIFETDATFTAVTVEKDIFLDGATFCGKAVFADITVMGTFYSQSTTFNIDVEFKDDLNKGIISEKLKKIFKTEDYSLSENAIVTKEKEDKWRITDREKIYIVKKEEGTLNIYNPTTFVHEADFGSARIGGNAEFPGVKFGGDTDFVSARIGGNAEFPGVKFGGDTDFGSARIGGVAEFRGAEFKQLATFSRAQIEESAFFNQATFWGEANFVSARIGSNAEFKGAEFKQLATFNSAQIEGAAFFNHAYLFIIEVEFKDDLNKGIISEKLKKIFKAEGFSISENAIVTKEKDDKWRITDREKIYIVKKEDEKLNIYNPTTFVDEADFGSARIGGTAEFQEATFTERAIFNGAQIGGVFFDPATFEAEANFVSARIGSNAEFQGAEFKQLATFNRAQIEESAFFNQATFWGEANFVSAQIGSRAKFIGAEFKQQAKFNSAKIEGDALFKSAIFEDEADFVSARIGSTAHFTGAEFKQQAIFNSAQIERESHFEGTVFANDVSFQDSSLKTVFWGEPNVQFNKNIDLRGCIYDRIQPITFWKQLMEHLGPYDRQPFTQLEETFRRAGKDKLADDVYYKRKCQEYTENIAIRMYLFSWDCVPGDDDEKLRKFLEDDLDIGWTENAEIRKSNDGKTLSISKDEKRSEIILDAIKKKATLKISDGRTFYLNVKKKQGKLNIYRTWDAWLHSGLQKHGSWHALLLSALRKLSALLLDRFLFRFTGYGVRLYRLLVAIVPILIIGTIIFHLEGAVTPEQLSSMMSFQVTLPCWEAFWVSLNTFLPIEIPSGADWKLSSQIIPLLGIKFTTFATLLVLAGWILVPVAVAGIAGLLKRPK